MQRATRGSAEEARGKEAGRRDAETRLGVRQAQVVWRRRIDLGQSRDGQWRASTTSVETWKRGPRQKQPLGGDVEDVWWWLFVPRISRGFQRSHVEAGGLGENGEGWGGTVREALEWRRAVASTTGTGGRRRRGRVRSCWLECCRRGRVVGCVRARKKAKEEEMVAEVSGGKEKRIYGDAKDLKGRNAGAGT